MKFQSHKVVYKENNKEEEIFFKNQAFKSAFRQAQESMKSLRTIKGVTDVKLYYRNTHSKYNSGWVRIG